MCVRVHAQVYICTCLCLCAFVTNLIMCRTVLHVTQIMFHSVLEEKDRRFHLDAFQKFTPQAILALNISVQLKRVEAFEKAHPCRQNKRTVMR